MKIKLLSIIVVYFDVTDQLLSHILNSPNFWEGMVLQMDST